MKSVLFFLVVLFCFSLFSESNDNTVFIFIDDCQCSFEKKIESEVWPVSDIKSLNCPCYEKRYIVVNCGDVEVKKTACGKKAYYFNGVLIFKQKCAGGFYNDSGGVIMETGGKGSGIISIL